MLLGVIFLLLFINILIYGYVFFCEHKNSRSLLFWTIIFLLLPIVAIIPYIIWGDGFRYGDGRQFAKKSKEDQIYLSLLDEQASTFLFKNNNADKTQLSKYISQVGYFSNLNLTKLYFDKSSFYESLFTEIEKARSTVNIECSYFENDNFGIRLRELLILKSKKGIDVKILYDNSGKSFESKSFFKPLTLAGAKVCRFRPRRFPFVNHNSKFGNYRNFIIIDNNFAYVGNLKLSENSDETERYAIAKISGEVAKHIDLQFFLDFSYATKKYYAYDLKLPVQILKLESVQFLSTADNLPINLSDVFLKTITSAKKEICIQSPVFLPSNAIIQALKMAVSSGIKLKIMVSSAFKNKLKFYACRAVLKDLAIYGAECYLYDGNLVANSVIIDDEIYALGSAIFEDNFLTYSFSDYTFIYDADVNLKAKQQFEKDIVNCFVISKNCKLSLTEKLYRNIYSIF